MPKRIFIDGMNLVRTSLSLARIEQTSGNDAARTEMLRLLLAYAEREERGAEWTVVFDGSGGPHDAERVGPVLCLYSGARTADEVIVESAADAVALGIRTVIVSSDGEVRCEGAESLRAEEFYDELIRMPVREKAAEEKGTAPRLVESLIRSGHLEGAALENTALLSELGEMLRYFAHGKIPPQKLAAKLEPLFREKTRVAPSPDPQKAFLRALKSFFQKD